MDNLLTGFYLLEFGAVIVVGLFWLQIFIRGALKRAFKFEYITYSIITICLVHFYFTYLIWQEDNEVLTLSSYFLLGLSTFKAWKWIPTEQRTGTRWKHSSVCKLSKNLCVMMASISEEKACWLAW